MTVTEIKLTGSINPKMKLPFATATIRTDYTSKLLLVAINTGTQLCPDIREHKVETDNEDDMFSMAQCLHFQLEGRKGSNSEIHDYYRMLQYFTK